jgi:hypothetical protein
MRLLLKEADRVEAEMGITSAPDQAGRRFDRFEEPDVLYWNVQQLTAGFIVLDHAKPEVHGIESTGGQRLATQHLYIRQRQIRQWK